MIASSTESLFTHAMVSQHNDKLCMKPCKIYMSNLSFTLTVDGLSTQMHTLQRVEKSRSEYISQFDNGVVVLKPCVPSSSCEITINTRTSTSFDFIFANVRFDQDAFGDFRDFITYLCNTPLAKSTYKFLY